MGFLSADNRQTLLFGLVGYHTDKFVMRQIGEVLVVHLSYVGVLLTAGVPPDDDGVGVGVGVGVVLEGQVDDTLGHLVHVIVQNVVALFQEPFHLPGKGNVVVVLLFLSCFL